MNLKQIPFNNYVREKSAKKQIVLHHTAGGGKGEIVYQGWQADRTPVATCVAISRDGEIVQGFGSQYWGYHLGMQIKHFGKLPYMNLDKQSIGIELCNWGPLTYKSGQYRNYVNGVVSSDDVIELEYRTFKYWQKYTDEQIESTRLLLVHWREKYGISLEYNEGKGGWHVERAAPPKPCGGRWLEIHFDRSKSSDWMRAFTYKTN